ncbi:NAD(+) diphosphatase [Devosia rhizoryzae]|uniref:NAD(+) diphosphatase n=1 Tax=Devosia rhizoryzae TaxID=2774137 RepID=A0ABX7CA67_9HYPH|nr:NAD(+) diphosphatase [Devosia rhizoryzae]QQR40154.1 NAD(+) diphosphatase [Devosia rhizoryzae]
MLNFAFSAGALDRAAHLRPAGVPDGSSRAMVFWRGKLLVDGNGNTVLAPLDHPAFANIRDIPVFIGLTPEGARYAADLALWVPLEDAATIGEFVDRSEQVHPAWPSAKFVEVRGIMASLTPLEGECVATARALLSWHGSHRFCANCGNPSVAADSGWVRKCAACGTHHFPRTDPVVIMAITSGNRLLLGRGASWPEGMYSLLAGFVEPGEDIETAVRREVFEESGIKVGSVTYVASQPWPFPMSLMFGCLGEAMSEEITLDLKELADARWVDREEVRTILAGTHPTIAKPRSGAIAGALIEGWADGGLAR